MRYLALLVLLGCAPDPDPTLEIVSPTDNTVITATGPITFTLHGKNLTEFGGANITVDRMSNAGGLTGNSPSVGCDDCTFDQTWAGADAVAPGTHEIEIELIYDLSPMAHAGVTLAFMRP